MRLRVYEWGGFVDAGPVELRIKRDFESPREAVYVLGSEMRQIAREEGWPGTAEASVTVHWDSEQTATVQASYNCKARQHDSPECECWEHVRSVTFVGRARLPVKRR